MGLCKYSRLSAGRRPCSLRTGISRGESSHRLSLLAIDHVTRNKALVFLHENHITHGDLHSANTVMDVLVPRSWDFPAPRVAGLRGPDCNYAFIDFETAATWHGMSPDATQRIGRAGMLTLEQACKHDVHDLASLLENRLRVSVSFVHLDSSLT